MMLSSPPVNRSKLWFFSIGIKQIYLGRDSCQIEVLDLAPQSFKVHGKEQFSSKCPELTSSDPSCGDKGGLTNPPSSPETQHPAWPGAERTSKRSGLYTVSGSSMWPRWPEQLLKSCTQVEHTSLESAGPRAKSYRPLTDGFPRLSRNRGFVMDLTLSFLRR